MENKTTKTIADFNLADIITRLSRREKLTNEESRYFGGVQSRYETRGISFEKRDLIGLINAELINAAGSKRERMITLSANDLFLDKCRYISGLQSTCKVPYFASNTVDWKEVGTSLDTTNSMDGVFLTPYRLTTNIDVSKQLLLQTDKFDKELFVALYKAVNDKLVESILSDDAAVENVKPKGIFNGLTASTLSSIDTIATLQYNGDKNKTKNIWLISPKAKRELIKLNPLVFSNGKFLGTDYIFENRMSDGLIAYLPLDLLVIGDWSINSLLVDPITDMINGNCKVYLDTYYDFSFADTSVIQLGSFA